MTSRRHPHYTRWPMVEGYCHPLSHEAGRPVPVHVAARCDRFTIEVARVGRRREVVWSVGGLRAGDHDVPDDAWRSGCGWPVAVTVPTDRAWPSGFYLVRLIAEVGGGHDLTTTTSEACFVLRAPAGRPANRSVLVLATNTWQAYNQWGGRCLYSGASAVSFARPLERGYLHRPAAPLEVPFDGRIASVTGPSDPDHPDLEHRRLTAYQATHRYPLWSASAGWHNWERRFVRWAETAGFGLDYATSADLDRGPQVLDGHALALSVGHDEYWTWAMRDSIDGWVEAGGNHAVFSGNTCFWQVRYDDEGRTMVCHKDRARAEDPVRGTERAHLLSSMWSDPLIDRPETSTMGLTFTRGGYHRIGRAVPRGAGAYTVHRPSHWALAGTGLCIGDLLGSGSFVVGYEVDGCALRLVDGRPEPTGEDGAPDDLAVVATAPARLISITDEVSEAPAPLWASLDPPGDLEGVATVLFGDASPPNVARIAQGHAVMGSFTRGRGTVFNAGSTDWAYGLDDDRQVQQVTANVLAHLGATGG